MLGPSSGIAHLTLSPKTWCLFIGIIPHDSVKRQMGILFLFYIRGMGDAGKKPVRNSLTCTSALGQLPRQQQPQENRTSTQKYFTESQMKKTTPWWFELSYCQRSLCLQEKKTAYATTVDAERFKQFMKAGNTYVSDWRPQFVRQHRTHILRFKSGVVCFCVIR